MIFSLVLRWKDSLKRDAETQNQKWLHVQMGLATADVTHRLRIHRRKVSGLRIHLLRRSREEIPRTGIGQGLVTLGGRSVQSMYVLRHFVLVQSVRLLAAFFPERMPTADMNRHFSPQV